ncbi:MAG: hypothetical protein M0R80_22750 [Proteobacteria bacterium]|nr:hypothetical protein [Pseudomonadota bacterium]
MSNEEGKPFHWMHIVRVLDSIGVRVIAPWSRDREALVARAPRSFESAMGVPDDLTASLKPDRHHAWHATISGPGGFAVMFLLRTAQLNAQADEARLWHGNCKPTLRTTRSRASIERGGCSHEAF